MTPRTLIPARFRRWFLRDSKPRNSDDANYAELWERSRHRWRNAEPLTHLTWAREISGDDFVSKMESYGAFGPEKSLLEIGPGYGRLLKSMRARQVAFRQFTGIDLSDKNIYYLNQQFAGPAVEFRQGDAEKIEFLSQFDVALSSLTFKHLFPTFERVLANIARYLNDGALIFFDLIEGTGEHFEDDGVTFLRHYTKEEVSEILQRCGLRLVAWDEVVHTPEHKRLLVVATKASRSKQT